MLATENSSARPHLGIELSLRVDLNAEDVDP